MILMWMPFDWYQLRHKYRPSVWNRLIYVFWICFWFLEGTGTCCIVGLRRPCQRKLRSNDGHVSPNVVRVSATYPAAKRDDWRKANRRYGCQPQPRYCPIHHTKVRCHLTLSLYSSSSIHLYIITSVQTSVGHRKHDKYEILLRFCSLCKILQNKNMVSFRDTSQFFELLNPEMFLN